RRRGPSSARGSLLFYVPSPKASMKKTAVLGFAALILFLSGGKPASAGPLHGYASVGGIDNGTNSPTPQNPITGFGFTVSAGPLTGDLRLDVLVPNNEASPPSFHVTGTSSQGAVSATATLFSATPWTSGALDSYLGISASPTNPIGAFLPSTQALDPGASGFFVYQVDLGITTLLGPSNPNVSPLLNITEGLPL